MATAALTWPCPYSRPVFRAAPRYVSACWPAVLCVCCGLSEMKFMASVLRPCKRSVSVSLSLSLYPAVSFRPFRDAKCKSVISAICERDERCVEVDVDARNSDVAVAAVMLLLCCCCCAVAAAAVLCCRLGC